MEDRKVRVLLEDIDHKFKTISEALSDITPIKENIAELNNKVDKLQEDMTIVKFTLKNKVDIKRVEKIEADVTVLQQKIA